MPTGRPTKMKPCKICGKMFLPDTPSSKICKDDHYAECPICKKLVLWNSTSSVPPCSKECKKEVTKQKNLAKYGCEHPMQNKEVREHHKQAMIDKYGVASPLQSAEIKEKCKSTMQARYGTDWALQNKEVKQKANDTMISKYGAATTLQSSILKAKVDATVQEKYGVDNCMQSKDVQEKAKQTIIERYGVDNVMKLDSVQEQVQEARRDKMPEIVEKTKQTCLKKYGVDNPSKSPEVLKKIAATMVSKYGAEAPMNSAQLREAITKTNLERYGVPYYCMTTECREANGHTISKTNENFCKKLDALNIPYSIETPVGRKSYDVELSGRNILIEIDPTYTHNTIGNHWDAHGLSESYHLEKTKLAEEHGYRCIHIFDWDNQDKVIDMLRPTIALNARDMEIWRINKDVAEAFIKDNHLQGSCRGQLLCLGLVKDNEIYQVMTFGESRYDKSYSVELLRLCTKTGYRVRGGASKLFKFATEEYGIHNIISYCDRSKFSGKVYEEIGMKFVRETPPQDVWSRYDKKITANLLRQRGYDQLFNTSYGKGTSNEALMLMNGWLPVYDCGQLVYEYR